MVGSESSIELFERWNAHRDARAFKEIVDRHASLVYSTCNRILRNAVDAEDGVYTVDNVNPGERYIGANLLADWGHLWKDRKDRVEVHEGTPAQLDIMFASGASQINGIVVDESGGPVSGRASATYSGADGGQEFNQVPTLVDGRFTIRYLPAGPVYLLVFVGGDDAVPAETVPLDLGDGEIIEQRIVVH